MYPNAKVGFRKDSHKIISNQELVAERRETMAALGSILKDYKILIKTHPHIKPDYLAEVKKSFADFKNVELVKPTDWAEGYIYAGDIILGSPPRSLTLYTAALMYPEKVIVSLDFNKELLGDTYRNFEGVEYLDSQEQFKKLLNSVKNGQYRKQIKNQIMGDEDVKEFTSFNELLNNILINNKKYEKTK